jgi:hypothetical protein
MISDAYIITVFYAEGKNVYANMNIGLIGANLFLQLIIVWAQTGKEVIGSAFFKEAVIALVGLKPTVYAWRVCRGYEQQSGQSFDALEEVRGG